ncbi:MAG TPA: DUF4197 domain-containing protein [Methylomirabilota bacterium]|jgi:hypothetical protein|nr:DUF4197 domain-containing protein [Methylomirabilota bacterium]
MSLTRRGFVALLGIALAPRAAGAQLDELLKQLPQLPGGTQLPIPQGGLGEVKIGQALKEALQVGTANAVKLTGKTDGYFKNAAIKILMPEKLRTLERGLRTVGYDRQLDDFVLKMNRAAERAAPAAKQIFWNAIGDMTIDDARKILDGAPTAATDYFKGKTTEKLTASFSPVVHKTMGEVGVTRQYQDLFGRAQGIPFLNVEAFDLDHYVVGKALDGLFHVVGDEEKKIRTNPSARVTDLLREVFGRR